MFMVLRAACWFGFVAALAVGPLQGWSDSTFALPRSSFLGENLDGHVGHGQILINKRNIGKRSLKIFETDQPVEWVSRYGSLTFNQLALDHPMSGMNEAGLVVLASENFGEGNAKAEKQLTINEYQWVQYQLDNYATVDEVTEHVPEIGISSMLEELHYLVCDSSTQCAAFEVDISNHHLRFFKGLDFAVRVLTDTGYADDLKKFLVYQSQGAPKFQMDPFDSNDRFLFLALKLSVFPLVKVGQRSLENVLALLEAVKQPGFTQWQVAFDASSKKIRYKTESTTGIGSLNLNSLNFSPESGVQTVGIYEYSDNISKTFRGMTHQDNVDLVDQSMSYIGAVFPAGAEQKLKSYPWVFNSQDARRIRF